MILKLLAESIGEPREPAIVHAKCEILPLNVAILNAIGVSVKHAKKKDQSASL